MLLKYQLASKSKAVVPNPIEMPGFLISMVQYEFGNLWLSGIDFVALVHIVLERKIQNSKRQQFFLIFEKLIEPVRLLENYVPKSGPSRK